MKKELLSLEQSHHLPALTTDYLNRSEFLSDYYRFFPEAGSFARIIEERKKHPVNREVLVKSLEAQYGDLSTVSGAVRENIRALLDNETFTVTTGHQLCLFTGPLYFVYKIVSTINLAQKLSKQFPAQRFVPVFWMATEDHDFEEINHARMFGKTLTWERDFGGPVGRMSLETLQPLMDELGTVLGDSDAAREVYQFFRNAYDSKHTLAEAARYMVNELFGSQGCVVIDGDDAELKRCFSPVVKSELLDCGTEPILNAVEEQWKGQYKTQVTARQINLFYILDKVRERIVKNGDTYEVLNTEKTFSEAEILAELESNPERFSPNVIMRPMYQESILPNLAYIGGGSEVAYWLQLLPAFENYKLFYPTVMVRNSAMILFKQLEKKMTKLKVEIADLFGNIEELVKDFVKGQENLDLDFGPDHQVLELLYENIERKAIAVDGSLQGAVKAEMQKNFKQLNQLESRILRAAKKSNEDGVNQLRNLREKLFPGGSMQERKDNVTPIFMSLGMSFIKDLHTNFDPFDWRMAVLRPE